MPLGFIKDTTLTDIADAIREKKEISDLMYPREMADLIRSIVTGIPLPSWITEFEFTTVTVASTGTTLTIPTSMSAAPKNILLWPSKWVRPTSGDAIVTLLKIDSTMGAGTTLESIGDVTKNYPTLGSTDYSRATINIAKSGNKVTVTQTGSLGAKTFTGGTTFRIFMWR